MMNSSFYEFINLEPLNGQEPLEKIINLNKNHLDKHQLIIIER